MSSSDAVFEHAYSKGWKKIGETAVGAEDGFPLVLSSISLGFTKYYTVSIALSEKPGKETIKEIKRELPAKGVALTALMTVQFTKSAVKKDPETIWRTLAIVTRILRNSGARLMPACPVCGGENTDAYALYNNAFTSVHRACIEQKYRDANEKLDDRQMNGSYLTGTVGALLGGLVGAIPSFLTIVLMEMIYAILCMLIPVAAYYGYKLFRGKPNKPAIAVVILSSLIQVFVLEISAYHYILSRLYIITFGESLEWYREHFFEPDMLGELAITFFFVLLGVIFSFRLITRTAASEKLSNQAVLDSIMNKNEAQETVEENETADLV
jgi:hypothetical protein